MNHSLTLPADQFESADNILLTKNTGQYERHDTLTLTKERSRDQKVKYITQIVTDKVHQAWCYLVISDTRGVDDMPESVGGQSMEHKANEA